MDFPTLISRTNPFSTLGVLGGIFSFFFSILNKTYTKENIEDSDQTPNHAASDLGLHCSHMRHKKDARLTVYGLR